MQALVAAWKKACGTPGTVTLVIPPGTYYIGPAHFHGPCEALAITFFLQASTCVVDSPPQINLDSIINSLIYITRHGTQN